MASPTLIFPSLSVAPQPNAVEKYEDGTISDPMESGYVATRPRFTRNRRTWSLSYRPLTLADRIVLDFFARKQAVLGANSFWFPNQLISGGMERPRTDSSSPDIVKGWSLLAADAQLKWVQQPELTAVNVFQPPSALLLRLTGNQTVPIGTFSQVVLGRRNTNLPLPISGETYLAAAMIAVSADYPLGNTSFSGSSTDTAVSGGGGAAINGMSSSIALVIAVNYDDGSHDQFSSVVITTNNSGGWTLLTASGTIAAGKNVISMAVQVQQSITNVGSLPTGGSPWVMPATGNPLDVWVDAVGLALTSSPQPYGGTAGLNPIPTAVRFTKSPQTAQIGWVNGSQAFTSAFDLTEV